MQATPKIASSIPRVRGQAMPDVAPSFTSSRNRGSALNPLIAAD